MVWLWGWVGAKEKRRKEALERTLLVCVRDLHCSNAVQLREKYLGEIRKSLVFPQGCLILVGHNRGELGLRFSSCLSFSTEICEYLYYGTYSGIVTLYYVTPID